MIKMISKMDEGLANNFSKRGQKKINDFHCHLLLPLKLDKKSLKRVHIKFTVQKRKSYPLILRGNIHLSGMLA